MLVREVRARVNSVPFQFIIVFSKYFQVAFAESEVTMKHRHW